MRTIKFRCWVKKVKDMCYPERLGGIESSFKSEDKDHVMMQYTGLKDKNGKEIYEGDIVKITDWPYLPASTAKDKTKPFYKNEKVLYQPPQFNLGGWLGFDEDSEYEVIGNIYENKHLLSK